MSENIGRLRGHLAALKLNERDRKIFEELLSDIEDDFENLRSLLMRQLTELRVRAERKLAE